MKSLSPIRILRVPRRGSHLSALPSDYSLLSSLLEELGQIRETLVIYPRRKGQHRPSTANCLTRMSPLQRRLFSLLDLQRYAKGVLTQSN